ICTMYKQYFKQAWQMLKENKFYSFIYILGTAFTITMVMLILTTYNIKTANFAPEVNRDRTLFVSRARVEPKDKNKPGYSAAYTSLRIVKECYYSLTTPELVTAALPFFAVTLNIPGSDEFIMCDRLSTDAKFWQLFSFKFIEGKPYDEADFESGIRKVVISQRIARQLYGTTRVIGETIEINKEPFIICGVVKDVPTLAENAYADIWLPYSSTREAESHIYDRENVLGPLHVYILAHHKDDFEVIRQEIKNKVSVINSAHEQTEYMLLGQPDDLASRYLRQKEVNEVNLKGEIQKYGLIIFFLLFIPVLNISGLIISRMKKDKLSWD
ncbi:MAG: ABC transporter permease, partial [Tannerellaceae bacterium]|nr:ABC transporter permease [Tannerellaceae bacterium]